MNSKHILPFLFVLQIAQVFLSLDARDHLRLDLARLLFMDGQHLEHGVLVALAVEMAREALVVAAVHVAHVAVMLVAARCRSTTARLPLLALQKKPQS